MLKSYFIIAFRHLYKNKINAFVNIFSLGLAVATMLVAYLNYKYENEFDRFHKNYGQIYKINGVRLINQQEQGVSPSLMPIANLLKENYPEIKRAVRVEVKPILFKVNDNYFHESVLYADNEFLEMFSFPLKWGEKESFKKKNTIYLTEGVSEKLFGDRNPVGKNLEIKLNQKKYFLQVAGVFQKIPRNSSMIMHTLVNFDTYLSHYQIKSTDWSLWTDGSFIQVGNPSALVRLEKELQKFVAIQNQNNKNLQLERFYLEPLANIHRSEHDLYRSGFDGGLADSAIYGIISSAVMILLLACFNFVNTSIAMAGNRLKEIGIRKTVGGTRRQLMWQFLTEHYLLLFIAICIGLCLSELLIPAYNSLFPFLDIELNYAKDISVWFFLFFLWLGMGLLAGMYPAMYLSAFNSIEVLKGKARYGGVNLFSKSLLVVQMSITVYLLVCSFSFYQNSVYQEKLDKGYAYRKILVVPVKDSLKLEVFSNLARQHPKVSSVSQAYTPLGRQLKDYSLKYQNKNYPIGLLEIGDDYLKTMGIQLLEGEDLRKLREDERYNRVLVNRQFVKELGWKQAVGQNFVIREQTVKVAGIVNDFHETTVMKGEKIRPVVLRLGKPTGFRYVMVRAEAQQLAEVNAYLKENWSKIFTELPYEGYFQEEAFRIVGFINGIIVTVNFYFTFVGILISLLSLYTLFSLTILKKIKEIGIRKIFGAQLRDIAWLVGKGYLQLMAIASVLGVISSYFVMELLLGLIYDYRLPISTLMLSLPVVFLFVTAVVTVGYKLWLTCHINPVEVLRNE